MNCDMNLDVKCNVKCDMNCDVNCDVMRNVNCDSQKCELRKSKPAHVRITYDLFVNSMRKECLAACRRGQLTNVKRYFTLYRDIVGDYSDYCFQCAVESDKFLVAQWLMDNCTVSVSTLCFCFQLMCRMRSMTGSFNKFFSKCLVSKLRKDDFVSVLKTGLMVGIQLNKQKLVFELCAHLYEADQNVDLQSELLAACVCEGSSYNVVETLLRTVCGRMNVETLHECVQVSLRYDDFRLYTLIATYQPEGYGVMTYREFELNRAHLNVYDACTGCFQGDCCICMENGEMMRLRCDHGFHMKCLMTWYLKSNSCPLCRAAIVDECAEREDEEDSEEEGDSEDLDYIF